MPEKERKTVYIGVRSVYESGNSYVVSIPKDEVKSESFEFDEEEILGEHRTTLTDDGEFRVNLSD